MRWFAVLLLIPALAGCLGNDEPSDPLDAETPAATGTEEATDLLGNLTASLLADVPDNATAPLNVTFTVDAPGAADPQNVSWSIITVQNGTMAFVAGGDGVPATANHTFEAGNHSVVLEVIEDGVSANQSLELVVAAAEAVGNGTSGDVATVHLISGSFAGGTADPTFAPAPSPGTGPVATHTFEVPHDAVAVHVWVDWDDGETGNSPLLTDLDLDFFDGAGKNFASPGTASFEYDYAETPLAAGTWTVEVKPYNVPIDTTYNIEVVAWTVVPQTVTFTGSGGGIELGTPVDAAPDTHAQTLPAGTQTVAGRMTWSTEVLDDCSQADVAPNDFDFDGILAEQVRFGRGSFASCEFAFVDAADGEDLGGDWSFVVHKYLTAPVDYTLTVFYA